MDLYCSRTLSSSEWTKFQLMITDQPCFQAGHWNAGEGETCASSGAGDRCRNRASTWNPSPRYQLSHKFLPLPRRHFNWGAPFLIQVPDTIIKVRRPIGMTTLGAHVLQNTCCSLDQVKDVIGTTNKHWRKVAAWTAAKNKG